MGLRGIEPRSTGPKPVILSTKLWALLCQAQSFMEPLSALNYGLISMIGPEFSPSWRVNYGPKNKDKIKHLKLWITSDLTTEISKHKITSTFFPKYL